MSRVGRSICRALDNRRLFVWGDRIFLTTATGTGEAVQRHVLCISLKSGQIEWDEPISSGPGESVHKMNGWATPSCATDGQRVVAFFGPGGLHCLDHDGKSLWSRELGNFPGAWGIGASPVIVGDKVIQNCDATGNSFLVAIDLATGKDAWKTDRTATPRGGWSTPVADSKGILLLNGEFGISAYETATGKPLWFCKGFNGRGTPMPVIGNGLVYVVNGKPGDVYSVRSGGSGDVTETHMAWHTRRGGGRDLPSPVLVGDMLLVMNMGGIATAYDALHGEQTSQKRVGGNFSGSPIAVANRALIVSESGNVITLQAGDDIQVLSETQLATREDEVFRASPALVGNSLLVRSNKRLYCLVK